MALPINVIKFFERIGEFFLGMFKTEPDTDGLRVYQIIIHPDELWQGGFYLPAKPRKVKYTFLGFGHNPSSLEVMEEVNRRRLRLPDQALAMRVITRLSYGEHVVCVCGHVESADVSTNLTLCVFNTGAGPIAWLRHEQGVWDRKAHFLAVIEEL